MQAIFANILTALVNSFWQSCFLAIFYLLIDLLMPGRHPLAKRNLLLLLILLQITLSIINLWEIGATPILFPFSIQRAQEYLSINITNSIIFIYLSIFLVKLIQVPTGLRQIARIVGARQKAPAVLRMYVQNKCREWGINKEVQLIVSEMAKKPFTFGFWKPVIVLPISAVTQLSASDLETILYHEIIHIKYNDFIINILLVIASAIYFFNPFTLYLIRQARFEREKNCDLHVIEYGYDALAYAQVLLNLGKLQKNHPLAVNLLSVKQELLQRILFITTPTTALIPKSKTFGVLGYVSILFLLIGSYKIDNQHFKKVIANTPIPNQIVVKEVPDVPSLLANNKMTSIPTSKPKKQTSLAIAKQPKQAVKLEKNIQDTEKQIVTQVSLNLTVPESEKDVTIIEESSKGEKKVNIYSLYYQNGKWNYKLRFSFSQHKDSLDRRDTIL